MAEDNKFNLVVKGELVPGASRDAVRKNLAKLFKLPEEKAALLLAEHPRVIRRDMDQATAMKWRAALQRAGLKSSLQPSQPQAQPEPAPKTTEPSAPAPLQDYTAEAGKDIEMVGTIRTGGNAFIGPFEVAEVGANMAESKEELPALEPAIDHLSLAPPGADIETLKEEQATVDPDISHLSIE